MQLIFIDYKKNYLLQRKLGGNYESIGYYTRI